MQGELEQHEVDAVDRRCEKAEFGMTKLRIGLFQHALAHPEANSERFESFQGRNSCRQRPCRDLARPRKIWPHHLTSFDAHGQPRDRRFAIPINVIERNGD